MNRPDKAGEPSMEEILASIREIIADTPDQPPASPLVGGAAAARAGKPGGLSAPSNDRPPPPSLDRLSSALRNPVPDLASPPAPSPAAPAPPSLSDALKRNALFGSDERRGFEDDLGDLLDEPPAPFSPARSPADTATKPDADAKADGDPLDDLLGPSEALPLAPAAGPDLGDAQGEETRASESADADETPPGPEPFVAAPVPPPPPVNSMASLRKSSFYPPQGFIQSPPAPAESAPQAEPREEPAPPSDPAPWPSQTAAPSWTPLNAARPPRRPIGASAIGIAMGQQNAVNFPHAGAADTAAAHAAASAGYDRHAYAGAAPRTVDRNDLYQNVNDVIDEIDATLEARHEPAPADSSAAAVSALDALAQGLAASSIGSAARSAPTRPHDGATLGTLVAQAPVPAHHEANGYPIRTLEDAVADMLKPLLQQWLADNMPRIIERALRVEAARGVRADMKSPRGM